MAVAVGGSGYPAHQAASRFVEDHNDMVSYVDRKCPTRAGVCGRMTKSFECVTIPDSKFSARVLV